MTMRSAINTLEVVERLAGLGPAGVSELARASGIPKSTVQRCLLAAAEARWIEVRGGEPTRWVVATRLLRLLTAAVDVDLRSAARPSMIELRDLTGDAVHLVERVGQDAVLLERLVGSHPVQVVVPLGFRVPLYAGATGKAILAAMRPDDIDALLPARLRRLTERTITNRSRLRAELAGIRRRGWAMNGGEWDATVAAVAAVIPGSAGAPIGALSVSATPDRLGSRRMAELGPVVARQAEATAGRLSASTSSLAIDDRPS